MRREEPQQFHAGVPGTADDAHFDHLPIPPECPIRSPGRLPNEKAARKAALVVVPVRPLPP